VTVLLIGTLLTITVNERLGEIATLRAIGIGKATVVSQVLAEGVALTVIGSALGVLLGLATARYLDAILTSFPGLPAAFSFFVPRADTLTQAAVVPVSAATALRALVDVGRVQSGQSVLVTGASGGVGTYAVQLAKAFGAEVTGVCSTAKADLVRSLGADHVIDYSRDDFADGSRRYDLVIDIAGNPSLKRLRRALRPRGTAVFVGGENAGVLIGMGRQLRGVLLSVFVRQRLALLTAKERASDYESLTDLIEAGQLVPSIDRTYPLEDAPLAVRQLEAGHVRGKVAITVDR